MPNTQELPVSVGAGEPPVRGVDQERPQLRVEPQTLRTLMVDGRRIAYQDVGEGPAVILAHSSAGSHRQWRSLLPQLNGYRVIAPDLLGYGASEPWAVNAPLDSFADVNVLVELAARAFGPVHLVGHSYGAAMALDAARVLGARVASLTLIEPVAFHLLRPAGRISEWYEIHQVGDQVVQALRLRREKEAAEAFMGYWIGRWRWWLLKPQTRQRIIGAMAKVGAEFEALERRNASLADYRGVYARTRLIVGERTRQPARAIVEELVDLLPDTSVRAIPGAGHMSPLTHPAVVNALITELIDATEKEMALRRTRYRWRPPSD